MAARKGSSQIHWKDLKPWLEELSLEFNRSEFLATDPIGLVYDYPHREDREIVAFICALFAFGNVKAMRKMLVSLLNSLSPQPSEFIKKASAREIDLIAKSFQYRFIHGSDLKGFLLILQRILSEHENLETFFASFKRQTLISKEHTPTSDLVSVITQARDLCVKPSDSRGLKFLFADPHRSAGKRWHLFLRWMVRKDEVDLGLWTLFKPAELILPLDTHLHQICYELEFTKRKQLNAFTALEVTERLRVLNPDDPLKYDFALCRLGVLRQKNDRLKALKSQGTFGPASN